MDYPIRYMGIGETLDTALKVLKDHIGLFFSISALTLIPVQLIFGFVTFGLAPELRSGDPRIFQEHPWILALILVNSFVTLVLVMPVVNGATIHGIASAYLSRPTSLGDCLKHGLRRWPALIGTSILMYLAICGGVCLCLVPGILLALWFGLAQQVVILENRAGPDALGRSKDLMKGEMGRFFVLGLILLAIDLAYSSESALIPQQHVQLIVNAVISAVFTTLTLCASTIFYFSCRCRLDNFDLLILVEMAEQG